MLHHTATNHDRTHPLTWIGVTSLLCFLAATLHAQNPQPPRYTDEKTSSSSQTENAKDANATSTTSAIAQQLPFAFYPSLNLIEVAFDLAGVPARITGTAPKPGEIDHVIVRVYKLHEKQPITERMIQLDAQGCGHGDIPLPKLTDGEYRVEYQVDSHRIDAGRTFQYQTFPWVGNQLGIDHQVYPPFVPVNVTGSQVKIVGRSYDLNAWGLFDHVQSLGTELLAAPMSLHIQSEKGEQIWRDAIIEGSTIEQDQALFLGSAQGDIVNTKSRTIIEEDGCAKVEITLIPTSAAGNIKVQKAWIDIPLRDDQVPLFHYVYENAMRHNYAGITPRGGKIVWDLESQFWCPTIWNTIPSPGSNPGSSPDDGTIFDAKQIKEWRNREKADSQPFVPYLWLGSEERGLAYFAENDAGLPLDSPQPAQEIIRQGSRVIMRIHLIQNPTLLSSQRTITFGLQASPTKPMDPLWRNRFVATGIGPVNPWGGYLCASKYPDNHDFQIVDKIQEARQTGKVDEAWFVQRNQARADQNRQVNGNEPWLTNVLRTANDAASQRKPAGTYFEEHSFDTHDIEWLVYEDEWSCFEFDRFRKQPGNWGAFASSSTDFRLYYADQWMRRGVSLYLDNVNPKRDMNPRFSAAYRRTNGSIRYTVPLWDQRTYYKRLWKLAQYWNRHNAPWPIDITFHMTNTQLLPLNTWASATLDYEAKYRVDEKQRDLPWPPDFVRAQSLGRTTGTIPYALDPLRSGVRHTFYDQSTPQQILANWAMSRIHEIRGDETFHENNWLSNAFEEVYKTFGYGQSTVSVLNYWQSPSPVEIASPHIKWIALLRDTAPQGLLLLQNYDRDAVTTSLRWSGKSSMIDVATREHIKLDEQGSATITLPAEYGTRMFLVANASAELPGSPLRSDDPDILLRDDFELGIKPVWTALTQPQGARQSANLKTEPAGIGAGNHVLRITGCERLLSLSPRKIDASKVDDQELSFHFRVTGIPRGRAGAGLLRIDYTQTLRDRNNPAKMDGHGIVIDIDQSNTRATWMIPSITAVLNDQSVPWKNIIVNRTASGRSEKQATSSIVPLELGFADTLWHTLKIRRVGQQHRIWFDEVLIFEATSPVDSHGGFTLSTGWRLGDTPDRHGAIEIDDVLWKRLPSTPAIR